MLYHIIYYLYTNFGFASNKARGHSQRQSLWLLLCGGRQQPQGHRHGDRTTWHPGHSRLQPRVHRLPGRGGGGAEWVGTGTQLIPQHGPVHCMCHYRWADIMEKFKREQHYLYIFLHIVCSGLLIKGCKYVTCNLKSVSTKWSGTSRFSTTQYYSTNSPFKKWIYPLLFLWMKYICSILYCQERHPA